MDENDVAIAFEILLEKIESVFSGINRAGEEAFRAGKPDLAKRLADKAIQIEAFRDKVKDLQQEWRKTFGAADLPRRKTRRRRVAERLRKGLRTPEEAFYIPILQSLVELGGSAEMARVLDTVEAKMKHQLNQYDLQPLPRNPDTIRWRNAAQWARNTLVREGLLDGQSPRGIWRITPAGREWLATRLADQHRT